MKLGKNVQRSTFNVQRLKSEIRFAAASIRPSSIATFNVERWTLDVFFLPCGEVYHARHH
jgi:hypothetical protein